MASSSVETVAGAEGGSPTTKVDTPDSLKEFGGFTKGVSGLIRELGPLIENTRASSILMTMGTVSMVAALAGKIRIHGAGILDLSSGEFQILIIVSVLLLASGALLRTSQQRFEMRAVQVLSDRGTRLVEKVHETANRQLDRSLDLVAASTRQGKDELPKPVLPGG
jgi:hypothetical protein